MLSLVPDEFLAPWWRAGSLHLPSACSLSSSLCEKSSSVFSVWFPFISRTSYLYPTWLSSLFCWLPSLLHPPPSSRGSRICIDELCEHSFEDWLCYEIFLSNLEKQLVRVPDLETSERTDTCHWGIWGNWWHLSHTSSSPSEWSPGGWIVWAAGFDRLPWPLCSVCFPPTSVRTRLVWGPRAIGLWSSLCWGDATSSSTSSPHTCRAGTLSSTSVSLDSQTLLTISS